MANEDAISQLLPWLFGAGQKDQKGAMDIQAKGTNNVQDLVKLLFDPQFAALFGGNLGAFDPMTQVSQPAPVAPYVDDLGIASYYLGNPNDPMSEFVAGLVNGVYTPTSAKAAITTATATEGHPLYGADAAPLQDTIDEAAKAIAQNTVGRQKYDAEQAVAAATYKKPDDMFSKAGLPNPMEQYTPEYFRDQSRVGAADQAMADAQSGYDTLMQQQAATPLRKKQAPNLAGQLFNNPLINKGAQEVPEWQKRYDEVTGNSEFRKDWENKADVNDNAAANVPRTIIDPVDLKARQDAKKKAELAIIQAGMKQQKANSSGYGAAYAAQQQGRTPFNDAVQSRLAMLRAAGLI